LRAIVPRQDGGARGWLGDLRAPSVRGEPSLEEHDMTIGKAARTLACAAMLLLACTVARAGDITVYTALEEDDVRVYLDAFAKAKPDIKVNVLRLSTGDLVARIIAEKANPRHDVIWGTALTQVPIPETSRGNGASVSPLDYNDDGTTDFLVTNGARGLAGPVQLISFPPPVPARR
jgi:hypothetical protein